MFRKIFLLLPVLLYPVTLWSQDYVSGVSTEAISMPSLPGSVEGLPLTINESGAKGQFNFSIEIKVPRGINGLSPDFKISYNSGDGQSEFGLGWSLNLQSISLDTKKGVPTYSNSDVFWGPDGELIRIEKSDSINKFYAPLINKKQNLYEYDDSNRTWIIHQGDGRKVYFGEHTSSRIEDDGKIFKWFVEKIADSVGNEIIFEYAKNQGYPYLSKVKYAFKDGTPHYSVHFQYEDREDVLENFKSTYLITRSKRCSEVKVKSGANFIIRSYELIYKDQIKSLLAEVKQHGEGGLDLTPPMPPIKFEYSEFDLNPDIKTSKIDFVDTQNIPPSLNKGRATIVDINRDSFPDILETSRYGAKVWLNNGLGGFLEHYKIPEFISVLGEEQTKLLDVDGDRVVDFVAMGLYPKYFKGGVSTSASELGFSSVPVSITTVPRYSIGSPNVKTIDINADGRLDIIAREPGNFKSFLSTSSGNWNRARDFIVNTGAFDLSSPYSFFSDMNGDGLIDISFVRPESVIYLPNKGNGEFASPVEMNFSESKPLILYLFKIGKYNFVVDINGDGFSDLINATESSVAISINEGNGSFRETVLISNIHEEDFNLKGLYITTADINGNNSTDIVWTNDFGDWRYVDFSNGLLNLVTKIDNGLGLKTNIEYEFATNFGSHLEAEPTVLPYPMTVVKSISEFLGNDSSEIKRDNYKYFGGYYDALENDFRGFNVVEKIEEGDASVDSLYTKIIYEQGRIGSKIHQQLFPLKKLDYEYDISQKAIGQLMKGEEYTIETLDTFTSLDSKDVGMPFVSQMIITEGDFEGNTRQHKTQRNVTLSSEGFIERDKTITFIDLSQIIRQEEQVLAITNISEAHITNRVCEKNIYDSSDALLVSEKFFYDNETTPCALSAGLLTKKEAWTGSAFETKSTYSYHSFGSLASFSDSLGHTTSIGYDNLNIGPDEVTNAANHTKIAVYNADNGLMTSLTDENGLTTSLFYDLYLRLTRIVGPADSFSLPTTEAIYEFGSSTGEPSALVIKRREKSGQVGTFDTKEFFDGKERNLYKITEGPTNRFVLEGTTYNRRNEKHLMYQKFFKSDFSFPVSMNGVRYFETKYDTLKRPTLIFNPEHSISQPSYKEFYYLVGETISYDEERKISYEYRDSIGRRVGYKDALENEVTYIFDPLDQMIKITDPQGSETIFGYDTQKRRMCKLDQTVGLTKYSYNSENLVIHKDMYGYVAGHSSCAIPIGITPRTVDFEYNDNLNRLTKIDFPSGSSTEDIIQSYDEVTSTYPKGRLTSVNFGLGAKKFDYDIYGNKSKTTLSFGPSFYPTEKVFDALGRVEKIIYPTLGSNALTIKYEFDEAANLIRVSDFSSSYTYLDDVIYSPLNKMQEGVFGNNTKFTFSYDELNQSYRLTDILLELLGTPNTILQQINYEYDRTMNIVQKNDQKNSFVENFTYDDLHRLTIADLGGATKVWSYDEIGNITNNDGTAYTYNAVRKQIVSTVGSNSYSFDSYGNISQDNLRTYSFDWNGKLKGVTKSSQTTSYDYGEDGIRILKTTPVETTIFIDKYTELRGSDVVRHIYADGKLIASIDELNNTTYSHQDLLNSSNLRTDSSGSIVKRIEHLPYGGKRLESGTYNNIKNRFTGQFEDEETELYYFKQRYYDPSLGRFLSADPLFSEEMNKRGKDSQSINIYSYVKNNPSSNIDENGLFGVSVGPEVTGFLFRGGSAKVSLAFSIDLNPFSSSFLKTELGVIKTDTARFGVGGSFNAGLNAEVTIGNDDLGETGSESVGVSGEVAGYGGSLSYSDGSITLGASIPKMGVGLSGYGSIDASKSEILSKKEVFEGLWQWLQNSPAEVPISEATPSQGSEASEDTTATEAIPPSYLPGVM